jgi:phage/plasmid-like protein (TIGR03299 family)
MAHELTINTEGKADMAFVGATPWHGLGQTMPQGATIDQWAISAGLNFTLQKATVNYWNGHGELTDFQGQFVLYRTDNGAPMATVSERYQPVQPIEALNFFRSFAEAGEMSIETAGSLMGGKKFWALARVNHGTNCNVSENDKINPYVLLASSCDKTLSTIAKMTTIRVVCNNTLSIATSDKSGLKIPHSTKFNPDSVKSQMGLVKETFQKAQNSFKKMHATKMNREEAIKFFVHLLSTPDERKTGIIDADSIGSKARSLAKYTESFENSPGCEPTLWGAVNAVTHAVDFNSTARSDDTRLNSAWFGQGDNLKSECYQLAQNDDLLESIIEKTTVSEVTGLSRLLDLVTV